MQLTKSVVCITTTGSFYKRNGHAFPLTGFVCELAHVTNVDSVEIMSTARQKLPYPCISQTKFRVSGVEALADTLSE